MCNPLVNVILAQIYSISADVLPASTCTMANTVVLTPKLINVLVMMVIDSA